MATNFPSSFDSLSNPESTDPLSNPNHALQHANANDAIEALEAKVGLNSSAVTSSLDYRIAQLESRLGAALLIPFTRIGTLATGVGELRFIVPTSMTIRNVWMTAGTAPTGSSVICDVNKNGTTIFTTQGDRPSIAAGQNAYTGTATPAITGLVAGDYLTVDIDQVGSSVAGENLTVVLYVIVSR